MFRFFILSLLASDFVCGQIVNNVKVRDHREWMVEVIGETMRTVEEREWCNLKLPGITQHISEDIIDWNFIGAVTYTNGFVVSIQYLDVRQDTLSQIWTSAGDTVTVEVTGQLRITDLAIGYDVAAMLTDGVRLYTGVITHPLVPFDFSVFYNVHTHDVKVTVMGFLPITQNKMRFLPVDSVSDALVSLFESNSSFTGVVAWAEDVFQPIAENVIANKVPFPGLCYNCT